MTWSPSWAHADSPYGTTTACEAEQQTSRLVFIECLLNPGIIACLEARSVQIGRVDFLTAKPQLQDLDILRPVEYLARQQALNQDPHGAERNPGHRCNRQEQTGKQKDFDMMRTRGGSVAVWLGSFQVTSVS